MVTILIDILGWKKNKTGTAATWLNVSQRALTTMDNILTSKKFPILFEELFDVVCSRDN